MKRLILSGLLALGVGCAHSASAPPSSTPSNPQSTPSGGGPGGLYSFQSGQGSYTVQVTPGALSGPSYQVMRYPGGFRGTIDGQPIDISWSDHGVHGTFASEQVNLNLQQTGDGTRVQGLWGGRQSDFVIGPKGVQGRIGRCDYSLGRVGDALSGQSTCAPQNNPSNTVVSLPAGIPTPLDGQSAAVLAMLLGQ